MTDHDLLIQHTVKIDTLCKLMRANSKQLSAFSDKLDKRCVHIHDGITDTHREIFTKIDKKTDSITFRWLIGIIILVVLTMAGVVGTDVVDVQANKKAIIQIEGDIDDMEEDLNGYL